VARIRNMPRLGWFVAGVAVAILLVPSGVAAAKAVLKFTGIEGANGNKADVTSAGQLQVAQADPSQFVQTALALPDTTDDLVPVAVPTTANALVISVIHVDTWINPSPGPAGFVVVEIHAGSSCAGDPIGSWTQTVHPLALGEQDISLSPGLGIPAGDALCARANTLTAYVSASGYTVPSAAVPAL
jgi:hypothetical protein